MHTWFWYHIGRMIYNGFWYHIGRMIYNGFWYYIGRMIYNGLSLFLYHCCGSMHRCLWFSNHSQPGVKFFTSHGATPHRNPRNLRHPTPEKPSPGPHGPQVYHISMCRTKTIPSHGRFMPLGLVTYRKTSQPSDTATVTGSPFPAGCRDRSMGCVRSSIPACHGMLGIPCPWQTWIWSNMCTKILIYYIGHICHLCMHMLKGFIWFHD